MSLINEPNLNYNDFNSLARLRVDARHDSKAALKEVAKQFESVFVQMMIKSMREASVPLQGELFHGDQTKAYTEMYDKQLGLELSKSNGIGLADVIVRQLSPKQNDSLQTTDINSRDDAVENSAQMVSVSNSLLNKFNDSVKVKALNQDYELSINRIQQSPHWNSPEDFIRDSWPHAQRAGEELGVDPRVILAQSALETGWGKKVHFNAQGENSYSLFGIKAGDEWQGKKVQFNTLEFSQGEMKREHASFRAYDSLSESYQDYVKFLQNNPRYQNALKATDSSEFSQQLQKAGYATDPDYANKIERIKQGKLMNNVVSQLKISTQEPLV